MEERKLVILGMNQAGKTTMLNYLRGKNNATPEGTSREDYQAYTYTSAGNIIYHIHASVDRGGKDEFVKQYPKDIEKANRIFFLFNVNLYLSDTTYRRSTHHRIFFINDMCKRYHSNNYRINLWGTFIDKATNPSQTKYDVKRILVENGFEEVLAKGGIDFINTKDF